MAKPTDKAQKPPASQASDTHDTPAQHIWLAGLGAMAKAQEQGTKAIEALVNDGLAFQRKSQAEAQQRLHEATERLTHIASDLGQQASGRVDRLEHLFEDRVAKALHRLGMPTLQDMHLLNERIARLEAQLAQAQQTPPRKTKAATPRQAAAGQTASAAAKTRRRTAG